MSNKNNGDAESSDALSSPKVFISYSWASPQQQDLVKEWAERLLEDGIDVVMDIFDLKEGQDKFAFMEKMVSDPEVTHVLMMCDKSYAHKSDSRKDGVGTETQIISKEVYDNADQSKFIPIACELDDNGNWCLPIFLKSRIGIDFSTPSAVNANWEKLVRVLYGKPIHEKPAKGSPPAFLTDTPTPTGKITSKYTALSRAIMDGKPSLSIYRSSFLDDCIECIDELRIRKPPAAGNFGQQVLDTCRKLKTIRDFIVDWTLLESSSTSDGRFGDELILFLERLVEMKARPHGTGAFNYRWYEAHGVFVYETFIYIISALIKSDSLHLLHEVFTSRYLQPEGVEHYGDGELASFGCFWSYSEHLQILAPEDRKLISPAAELIKRHADRDDLKFESLIEAESVIMLMALLLPSVLHWYPGTLLYSQNKPPPLFARAAHNNGFRKLCVITGETSAPAIQSLVKKGWERMGIDRWHDFRWHSRGLASIMNLENLNTIS
jgi:hypothetical protein